jgi:uncharacterized protein YbjT (DUF2867 family)
MMSNAQGLPVAAQPAGQISPATLAMIQAMLAEQKANPGLGMASRGVMQAQSPAAMSPELRPYTVAKALYRQGRTPGLSLAERGVREGAFGMPAAEAAAVPSQAADPSANQFIRNLEQNGDGNGGAWGRLFGWG